MIVITGYSAIDSAVKAVKLGAFDYLPKPFTPDELRARVDGALAARAERRLRQAPPVLPPGQFLAGSSEALRQARALIAQVAPTDATVLITGESGTGKELAALELHAASQRRGKPLVSLDLLDARAGPPRERALRPRQRLLHRRGREQAWTLRDGGSRDALP